MKKWLEQLDFQSMIWPAQYPDLKPISNLYGYLTKRLAEHNHSPNKHYGLWSRYQLRTVRN